MRNDFDENKDDNQNEVPTDKIEEVEVAATSIDAITRNYYEDTIFTGDCRFELNVEVSKDFENTKEFQENLLTNKQLSNIEEDTTVFQNDQIQRRYEEQESNINFTHGLIGETDTLNEDFASTLHPSHELTTTTQLFTVRGQHTAANTYTSLSVEPTDTQSVYNPDQVTHDFASSDTTIQLRDQVVLENTERSPISDTTTLPQVDNTAVLDRPGFQGLSQDNDLLVLPIDVPSAIAVNDNSQCGMCNLATKPFPRNSSHAVNVTDFPVDLPSHSLYVEGTLQGRKTLMLVDTGASVTAISNTLISKLSTPPQLQPSSLPTICTVSGEKLPVSGQATLNFTIGGHTYPFTALVIDNFKYPVVLGRDFLMHFGSVIDLQGHTLTLSGLSVPLFLSSSPKVHNLTNQDPVTVHTLATYILPPMSESVIPVYPKTSLSLAFTGLIEPNPNIAERYHVCGASQLVSFSEDRTFPFRVLNPTEKPVTIYRCTTMGTFTPATASMSDIAAADPPEHQSSIESAPAEGETAPLNLSDTTLDEQQQAQLKSLVSEYRDILALKPEELGRTSLVQHRVDTGDHAPIRQRPYRVSETQRGIIEEHVTDMLNRGIIQPSTSPWASPIILVKKKDGTDRFVVDFRRLNSVTRKDSYPLPRIGDALDALNGTKYFSSIDLMSGFWQVEMEPESREHTAFITYGE